MPSGRRHLQNAAARAAAAAKVAEGGARGKPEHGARSRPARRGTWAAASAKLVRAKGSIGDTRRSVTTKAVQGRRLAEQRLMQRVPAGVLHAPMAKMRSRAIHVPRAPGRTARPRSGWPRLTASRRRNQTPTRRGSRSYTLAPAIARAARRCRQSRNPSRGTPWSARRRGRHASTCSTQHHRRASGGRTSDQDRKGSGRHPTDRSSDRAAWPGRSEAEESGRGEDVAGASRRRQASTPNAGPLASRAPGHVCFFHGSSPTRRTSRGQTWRWQLAEQRRRRPRRTHRRHARAGDLPPAGWSRGATLRGGAVGRRGDRRQPAAAIARACAEIFSVRRSAATAHRGAVKSIRRMANRPTRRLDRRGIYARRGRNVAASAASRRRCGPEVIGERVSAAHRPPVRSAVSTR